MPVAALDNWQPVWNAQVSISTPVCVNFELRPGAGDIHICWFNFDALAQGIAYKPTKEPINYRGPVGDRTHDLQTEATPPAASCPAQRFTLLKLRQKTQLQWHARGCTGQLTTRLECTGVNFNTCVRASQALWHRHGEFAVLQRLSHRPAGGYPRYYFCDMFCNAEKKYVLNKFVHHIQSHFEQTFAHKTYI